MNIPRNIIVGDSLEWLDAMDDYLSPGWSLRYVLVSSLSKIEIESTPDAETLGHSFYVPSTTSENWQPGEYSFQLYATDGTDRKTVGRGFVEVEVDYAAQDTYDGRPLLDREIEAVQQAKLGRASSSQMRMEIDGCIIEHMSHLDHDELLTRLYKRRAARDRARDVALGKSPFGTVRVEFNGL